MATTIDDVVIRRGKGDDWQGFIANRKIATIVKSSEVRERRMSPVYTMTLVETGKTVRFHTLRNARLHLRRLSLERQG
jgi:hypothetical protein